jgi:hypothetical protein
MGIGGVRDLKSNLHENSAQQRVHRTRGIRTAKLGWFRLWGIPL